MMKRTPLKIDTHIAQCAHIPGFQFVLGGAYIHVYKQRDVWGGGGGGGGEEVH